MKIAPKLTLGYFLVACLVIFVGLAGVKTTRDTQGEFERVVNDAFPTASAIQDVRFYGLRIVSATVEYSFLHSDLVGEDLEEDGQHEDEKEELQEEAIVPFDRAMAHYGDLVTRLFPEEKEIFQRVQAAGEHLRNLSAQIIELIEQGVRGGEILEAKEQFEEAEEAFLETIAAAIERESEELAEANEEVAKTIETGFLLILWVSVGAFGAALLLGLLLARGLSKPIIQLKETALALGQGNLDARCAIATKNEIGVLAETLNSMGEALASTTVSKDYVENILGSMADTLMVLDDHGNIKRVNDSLLKLLGYQEQELLEQPLSRIIEDQSLRQQISQDLTTQGRLSNQEGAYRSKDAKPIPVNLSGTRLCAGDGRVLGTVLVAQDITERKQAEMALAQKTEELKRSNKELDQFAYIVSHDLKAPLRAIANLATWIEEDLDESIDEDIKENLTLLKGRVKRMEGLINGVLEYSRIGRVAVDVKPTDIGKLLEETVDSMPVPEGFVIDIGADMPTLETTRVRLGQVFSNLISNAIKYCDREDGRVEISVEDAGDFFHFRVADNGPGIAEKFHEKVFGIFQTLTGRDKVDSTGVGLTLVKKIVEEQGGTIVLESQEGQGATFCFTWPKQPIERQAA